MLYTELTKSLNNISDTDKMPRKGTIPIHHLEFINLVAKGMDQTTAYQRTVKPTSTNKKNHTVKASGLARRYSELIQERREKAVAIINKASDESLLKLEQLKIPTPAQAEFRAFEILFANSEVDDVYYNQFGKPVVYKRPPTAFEINKAWNSYSKRFGLDMEQKHHITGEIGLKQVIINIIPKTNQ